MSETEYWKGKLTRVVEPKCATLEGLARAVCEAAGVTSLDSWNETWLEQMRDDLGTSFIVYGGDVYQIERQCLDADGDIFDAERNNDGSIDFTVRYYNGGCGFGEAVEAALDNLKDRAKD